MNDKLTASARLVEVVFSFLSTPRRFSELRCKKAICATSILLCFIHCGVRELYQHLGTLSVGGVLRNANARTDLEFMSVDQERIAERRKQFLRDCFDVLVVGNQRESDDEFISA